MRSGRGKSQVHTGLLFEVFPIHAALTSEIDLDPQQPNSELRRVWGLVIAPGCIDNEATSVDP